MTKERIEAVEEFQANRRVGEAKRGLLDELIQSNDAGCEFEREGQSSLTSNSGWSLIKPKSITHLNRAFTAHRHIVSK